MNDKINIDEMQADFAHVAEDIQTSLRDLQDTLRMTSIKLNNASKGKVTTTREALSIFSTRELKEEIRARQHRRGIDIAVGRSRQNKKRKRRK